MSDLKIKTAAGKAPLDMIPLRALKGAARVFQYGAKKYARGNFLQATIEDGAAARYAGGGLRHLSDMQNLDGTWSTEALAHRDAESGLPEIDHLICTFMMKRAILIKEGVLPEDPGEGKDPPGMVTLVAPSPPSIEMSLIGKARVSEGHTVGCSARNCLCP